MDSELKQLTSSISTLIALQILTLIVIIGGSWFLYNDLKSELISSINSTDAKPGEPSVIEDWKNLIHAHNAVTGPENSEIVIIEYTDFECPFCKKHAESTRNQILENYGDSVRIVFKHFPLEAIHPKAKQLAIAAQCAVRDGKFWEIQEIFFKQQTTVDTNEILDIGKSLGLGEGYVDCVINEMTLPEVEQDIEDGLKNGIEGTPTFVVNGKVLVGAAPFRSFENEFANIIDN